MSLVALSQPSAVRVCLTVRCPIVFAARLSLAACFPGEHPTVRQSLTALLGGKATAAFVDTQIRTQISSGPFPASHEANDSIFHQTHRRRSQAAST